MGLRILKPAERLVVAADYKLDPKAGQNRNWVRMQVLMLADQLKETGVCLKVNSVLRACGYDLLDEIHERGLKVFADLKFSDIPETLATDALLLRKYRPEFLTVACAAGVASMRALKAELPDTEVLGVTVPTTFGEADSLAVFGCSVEVAVLRLATLAEDAALNGIVSSGMEVEALWNCFGIVMTYNAAGIRPEWAIVPGDDQNPERVMTPAKAIKAGADRIIIGRPIIHAPNPCDAVKRTIDEIVSAT